jgi:hypothetical protein
MRAVFEQQLQKNSRFQSPGADRFAYDGQDNAKNKVAGKPVLSRLCCYTIDDSPPGTDAKSADVFRLLG